MNPKMHSKTMSDIGFKCNIYLNYEKRELKVMCVNPVTDFSVIPLSLILCYFLTVQSMAFSAIYNCMGLILTLK